MNYELELFDLAELESDAILLNNASILEIILKIKKNAFELQTDESLRLYVQNYQAILVGFGKSETCAEAANKVLYFLENTFPKQMDTSLPVSNLYRERKLSKIVGLIEEERPRLKEIISPELFKVIKPLVEPINQREICLKDARYLSNFWSNWLTDFPVNKEAIQERDVINYLITHNFNTHAFTSLVIGKIIRELSQYDQPDIQIEILTAKLLNLKRTPISLDEPFLSLYPKPYTVLETWFTNEINNARKKLKVYNPKQLSIIPQNGNKLETSLSVAQLACLLNTLYRGGILVNSTQSEILQLVSETVKCKKSDQISFGSLYNKYYDIEEKTKESVKETLLALARQIS